MRLIDADALLMFDTWTWFDEWGNFTPAGDIVNTAPTIDAEPVVRCKDCKYFELNHEDIEYKPCNGIEWCNNWCGGTTAGGYCCEAERREP